MFLNMEKLIKSWLLTLLTLLLLMIAVGGITRLTRSGLSITEWNPVIGTLPPLSETAWEEAFLKYQTTPEFKLFNSHFKLADYKNIFVWEYLHRLLGRFIFFMALLPGLYFWKKRKFSGRKVALITFMVALQGLVGWLMVKSGLKKNPMVSPFMLTLHFFSALSVLIVIYNFLYQQQIKKYIFDFSRSALFIFVFLGGAIFSQIFYGCLTAGWKAGFIYNTYPLMNGSFFPHGVFYKDPWWVHFFSNPVLVQWTHRWLAILVLVFCLSLYFMKQMKPLNASLLILTGLVILQIFLGVLNILFAVPIFLGVSHQVIACLIALAYFDILFKRFRKTV